MELSRTLIQPASTPTLRYREPSSRMSDRSEGDSTPRSHVSEQEHSAMMEDLGKPPMIDVTAPPPQMTHNPYAGGTLRSVTSNGSLKSGTGRPSSNKSDGKEGGGSASKAPGSSHSGRPLSNAGSTHSGRPVSNAGSSKVEFVTDNTSSYQSFSQFSAREGSPIPSNNSNGPNTDHESIPDVWENTSDTTDVSMSGYSAHSGRVEEVENVKESFFVRLVKFYQKYNPDKLCRVEEFLAAYKGEEEQLFAILTEKYGPEPDADIKSMTGSDGSYFHALGKRDVVPKIVSPEDGKTHVPTPYWPMSSAITDPDLMSLLRTHTTSIEELKKCYIGILKAHPTEAWNGMTYITEAPLPTDTSVPFLGHLWSGSLANNKVLVHNKENYHRSILHCSDVCQKTYPHARWRLTMIRHENQPKILFRAMWDPVIRSGGFKPPASSAAPPTPVKNDQQQQQDKPFFSFSWAKKKTGSGSARRGSGTVSPQSESSVASSSVQNAREAVKEKTRKQQPQQPQTAQAPPPALSGAVIDKFIQQLQALEGRLSERLDDMDRRLRSVERLVTTHIPGATIAGPSTSASPPMQFSPPVNVTSPQNLDPADGSCSSPQSTRHSSIEHTIAPDEAPTTGQQSQ